MAPRCKMGPEKPIRHFNLQYDKELVQFQAWVDGPHEWATKWAMEAADLGLTIFEMILGLITPKRP